MFDIAFSELVVIALVALIVIGPERLPKLARTAGHLWGRTQRYVNKVKDDIAHDMALDQARKMQHEIEQHVAEAEKAMQANGLSLEQSILQSQYKKPADADSASPPAAPSGEPTK
ncbi:MAG: Sec-independent protein translocase protein TatB [Gammaproteobacteria bacterium]|nr:Sec-independent protein translocase protein TatB [Gammaproteobacteria bacterium]MBU1447481.1 Sec-independent protein translocase protein TatB [Gammaproteobacteria bacterium]